MLHRGANPSASNQDLWTSLHFAVKKKYKGVCSKLLEHEAWPNARDRKGVMPFTLAYDGGNDDIASMLITYMSNVLYVIFSIICQSILIKILNLQSQLETITCVFLDK